MDIKLLLPISSRNSKIYFYVLFVFHWKKKKKKKKVTKYTFVHLCNYIYHQQDILL